MTCIVLASMSLNAVNGNATNDAVAKDMVRSSDVSGERMDWFTEARLGIFIHWGIYSVNGVDESWSFFNKYLPYDEYMGQLDGFTAANYDPAEWADLIAGTGAGYSVLVSKHHDGVALWDTQANDLSVPKQTPAARDVLTPLVEELRERDLKVGIYYSLMDWSHPDFPAPNREASRNREMWIYNPEENPDRWDAFMDFNFVQYNEIAEQFRPDIWWFDGHWWFSKEEWRSDETAELIFKNNPDALINSRLPGYGDFLTPEQGVPLAPKDAAWEACLTTNGSWGYQPNDSNYKSAYDVINMLIDCAHLGGNLLLNIGPKADGTIPEQQVEILKGLGRWTQKHGIAVFGTKPGIPLEYYNGPSTLSTGAYTGGPRGENDILYLFVPNRPNGAVRLKGLENQINRAWVVGNGRVLQWRQDGSLRHPGIYYFDVPEDAQDPDVTVLAIMLEGRIKLQDLH